MDGIKDFCLDSSCYIQVWPLWS